MKTMNNKKLYITVLGAAALTVSSCGDSFLDVASKTESNTETFYSTENDAYRALIGCYDGWQVTSSSPGFAFYAASEVMGDNCFGGTGNGDDRKYQVVDRFDYTEAPSEFNIFESEWSNYYAAIYRCNMLIMNEENIAWKSEEKMFTYMGECRTLRAMC